MAPDEDIRDEDAPESVRVRALPRRFYTLEEVADLLATSRAQVYALVRSGDLRAIKIGGRGQWRVEVSVFEEWVARMYEETATFVTETPFGG